MHRGSLCGSLFGLEVRRRVDRQGNPPLTVTQCRLHKTEKHTHFPRGKIIIMCGKISAFRSTLLASGRLRRGLEHAREEYLSPKKQKVKSTSLKSLGNSRFPKLSKFRVSREKKGGGKGVC